MVNVLASMKTGKSPGIDGIGAEFLKSTSAEAGRLLHPLLVKIAFQTQAPLAYKGGLLASFWKGNGGDRGAQKPACCVADVGAE